MTRQQRRRFDRELQQLMQSDSCSVCGGPFAHNCKTYGGLDERGRAAYVGECCVIHLQELHGCGLYVQRHYDFLEPRGGTSASVEEIADGIAACQVLIAQTDQRIAETERLGGVVLPAPGQVTLRDTAWKADDRTWFAAHPDRSHRARLPFPGEFDVKDVAAEVRAGHVLILLVRQVAPGQRIKLGFNIKAALWPVPDIEAAAHALFDIASGKQPVPANAAAFCALVEQYFGSERTQ